MLATLLVLSLVGVGESTPPTPTPPIVFQCGSATPGDLTSFTLTIDTVAQSVNVYWARLGVGHSVPATKTTPSEIDWRMPVPGGETMYYSLNRQSGQVTMNEGDVRGSIQCK